MRWCMFNITRGGSFFGFELPDVSVNKSTDDRTFIHIQNTHT